MESMILIRDAHISQNRENLAKKDGKYYYIGRRNTYYDLDDSLLRNRYTSQREGSKKRAIEKFRQWLWEEIKKKGPVYEELRRLANLAESQNLFLVCWCKNEEA